MHEEEENYYKSASVTKFWSKNCIEYKSNGDEIKHYQLKNMSIKLGHI